MTPGGIVLPSGVQTPEIHETIRVCRASKLPGSTAGDPKNLVP